MEKSGAFYDSSLIAIFCQVVPSDPGREQLHTGFVLKDDNGELSIIDLQWHYMFSKRDIEDGLVYVYSIPDNWTRTNQVIIRARLNRMARLHADKIPYSVVSSGVKFVDGNWLGAPEGDGLTCATFVSEVLHSLGLPVVDLKDWHARPDDEGWMLRIVGDLRQGLLRRGLPTSHVDIQLEKIRNSKVVRVRPADVLVAADRSPTPWRLVDIESESNEFTKRIKVATGILRTTDMLRQTSATSVVAGIDNKTDACSA